MQHVDQQPIGPQPGCLVQGIYGLIHSWVTMIQVFTRRNIGRYYLGRQCIIAPAVAMLYSLCWVDWNIRPLFWFFAACFVLTALHRLKGMRWGGLIHNYYFGDSRLRRLFPWGSDELFRSHIEFMLLLVISMAVMCWDIPVGVFCLIGVFLMIAWEGETDRRMRERAKELYDSMIEQEALARQVRGLRGDV